MTPGLGAGAGLHVESALVRIVARPCDPPFAIDWAVLRETAYVICELHADGETGFGYCFMFDSRHATAAATLMCTLLQQALAGTGPATPAGTAARLSNILSLTGHPGIGAACAAAIEMALWDLWARQAGLTWAGLHGHTHARTYPGYITCGSVSASPEQVARDVETAMASGFHMVKVKVGSDDAHDDRRLAAARRAGGDAMRLLVDANQTWDYKTARSVLHRWESEYDLFWVEEPLRACDIENLRRLRDSVDVRIATGESYHGRSELTAIIQTRAADVLTINPQKVGGVAAFRELTAACNLMDVAVTCHTFGEVAANLLLDARDVPGIEIVPWMLGVFEDAPRVVDGRVHVPAARGLGLRLSHDAGRWTTSTTKLPLDQGTERPHLPREGNR